MAKVQREAVSRHAGGGKAKYRHPLLKFGSQRLLIYRFVYENPGVTFKQIKKLTSSGQPVTDLVNAGLLRTEGESKQHFQYYAVPENETGPGRDVLVIENTVYINEFGEYSVTARLVGQVATATEDNPQPIHSKTTKISVPSPKERQGTVNTKDDNTAPKLDNSTQKTFSGLIIEGDYTIIPK